MEGKRREKGKEEEDVVVGIFWNEKMWLWRRGDGVVSYLYRGEDENKRQRVSSQSALAFPIITWFFLFLFFGLGPPGLTGAPELTLTGSLLELGGVLLTDTVTAKHEKAKTFVWTAMKQVYNLQYAPRSLNFSRQCIGDINQKINLELISRNGRDWIVKCAIVVDLFLVVLIFSVRKLGGYPF